MGSGQASVAQSGQSSLSAPPVQAAGSQQQHKRGGQQTVQPGSSDRGPVLSHAQDGQVQVRPDSCLLPWSGIIGACCLLVMVMSHAPYMPFRNCTTLKAFRRQGDLAV